MDYQNFPEARGLTVGQVNTEISYSLSSILSLQSKLKCLMKCQVIYHVELQECS